MGWGTLLLLLNFFINNSIFGSSLILDLVKKNVLSCSLRVHVCFCYCQGFHIMNFERVEDITMKRSGFLGHVCVGKFFLKINEAYGAWRNLRRKMFVSETVMMQARTEGQEVLL